MLFTKARLTRPVLAAVETRVDIPATPVTFMLFHVSEDRTIEVFKPRHSDRSDKTPAVWAIDADHLRNYLLPRDCPRVTFYAGPATSDADRRQFLGSRHAVVAIERDWFRHLSAYRLYCYHLPPQTFTCVDECAGYFTSAVAVAPVYIEWIDHPLRELRRRGVSVQVMPSLWSLHDAIAASTLQFSMIRMRNAKPRR